MPNSSSLRQAYYNSLIHMLSVWGVDFIKADDITGHPREIDAVVRAIESSGRDIVLSLSPGGQTSPAHMPVYQKANMLRTTTIEPRKADRSIGATRSWLFLQISRIFSKIFGRNRR